MNKKIAPSKSVKPKPEQTIARDGQPSKRTPGSKRDIKEKRKLVKFSESGMNRHGKPKKKNTPDTVTENPVTPDKDPTPEHILRGFELGLNLKQIEFVEVYLTCYNGARTYMAVYGTKNYNMAGVEAHRMLGLSHVKTYLGERMKQAFSRTEAAQDQVIQAYTYLAYGDVNELVEHRRESCRYCHGIDHRYQSTPEEMRRARDEYELNFAQLLATNPDASVKEFDEQGGVGFDPRREPHEDCPECHGEGRARVHIHDTRNLSPAALAMYEGAEITKDGIKIKTSSRDGAREKLAKILKIYEDTGTQVNVLLSSEELEKRFGDRMRIARERDAAMRAERGMPAKD